MPYLKQWKKRAPPHWGTLKTIISGTSKFASTHKNRMMKWGYSIIQKPPISILTLMCKLCWFKHRSASTNMIWQDNSFSFIYPVCGLKTNHHSQSKISLTMVVKGKVAYAVLVFMGSPFFFWINLIFVVVLTILWWWPLISLTLSIYTNVLGNEN